MSPRQGFITSMTVIMLLLASLCTSYAGSVNYTYDALNRLIKVEYEDGKVIQYTYDGAGNRTATYVSTAAPVTIASPLGGI